MKSKALTALFAYERVDKIADAIDDSVWTVALNSHGCCSMSGCSSTVKQVEKITALMNKKVDLINLKVAVEQALCKVKPLYSRLLVEKYLYRNDSADISDKLNLPLSTYYRSKRQALSCYEAKLTACGLDEQLFDRLLTQPWLKKIYDHSDDEDFLLQTVVCN